MARILIIAESYPEPDRASGDLRFFSLLRCLARDHQVCFFAYERPAGDGGEVAGAQRLRELGISVLDRDLPGAIRSFAPQICWFEFHYAIRDDYLGLLTRHSRAAKTIADTVDVHFNRLQRRADLTGASDDARSAELMRERELAAYRKVDMAIAVSEDDAALLRTCLRGDAVEVGMIPNLHHVPEWTELQYRDRNELVFIGGFKHDPNVDAVLFFSHEILPRISREVPEARLTIIGADPPESVRKLADHNVAVLGHVPSTAPYLYRAGISVAPLRYGGGMKGKVGEAMSFGVPVVTTRFGAEGFGVEVGRHLLLGDTPAQFAEHVISLIRDDNLYQRIARAGRDFIVANYSVDAVENQLHVLIDRVLQLPQRNSKRGTVRHGRWRLWFDTHVAGRLR